MIHDTLLLIFAIAFMGCVLTTPLVTRLAAWLGAIDRPDKFRRIHSGATPRLGGLGLAVGLACSLGLMVLGGYFRDWEKYDQWWGRLGPMALAALLTLVVGVIDDTRGMRPRLKLLGQAAAVLVLFWGGIRIEGVTLFDLRLEFVSDGPDLALGPWTLDLGLLPSLAVTQLWFLGCMNIWNLIDGMDGLASGVGLLVTGTLLVVSTTLGNYEAAILAVALAGSLAGFLLYNWHPACIFLGDSGSLLIGLLIGVIGVEGSLKGPSAVAILFPILAMGLPISDTAMAIFRRWARNLPLTAADRRHVHHLLIAAGLSPRQAALLLYCFSGFLCGVVMLGVSFNNELLALMLGVSGCAAFLLILTSRRDELATLRADFLARIARGRQERAASKATWEAIQRIELSGGEREKAIPEILEILRETSRVLGCDGLRASCRRDGRTIFEYACDLRDGDAAPPAPPESLTGATATFRLTSGQDLLLTVALHQSTESPLAADIAFRFLQRLSLATAERLERLLASGSRPGPDPVLRGLPGSEDDAPPAPADPTGQTVPPMATVAAGSAPSPLRDGLVWLRIALGGPAGQ